MLENYFNLKNSFVFYGSYHHNLQNKLIHFCFIPTIFTTALHFVSKVPLAGGFNLSDLTALVYASSFVKMEPGAGLLYAPVIYGMHYIANNILKEKTSLAIGLHVFGWICQFIGHGVFERRAPALLDNPLQAIHAAVFFVWLEIFFALGYKPQLHKELNDAIEVEIAKFQDKKTK